MTVTLADDIRARVEVRDRERIAARADAAAAVAEAHQQHVAATAALAAAAQILSDKIATAKMLMSAAELFEFTEIPAKELAPASGARAAKPVRRTASKPKRTAPAGAPHTHLTEN